MDIDIEKLVKAATEGLDLSNFKGDVVGVKIVENEIGNVEPGGIAIQIINGSTVDNDYGEDDDWDDCQAMKKAEALTSNGRFLAIMEKTVEQGLCTQEGWQFRWKDKIDAVYFASEASHKFHLSHRHDPDGGLAISWKPFEALFGEKGFRSKYNDYRQGKIKLRHKEEIDTILK